MSVFGGIGGSKGSTFASTIVGTFSFMAKCIVQMGIDHIIFGYNFIPMGRDLDKVMDITKHLSKFAR
jgi:hypothetical protein